MSRKYRLSTALDVDVRNSATVLPAAVQYTKAMLSGSIVCPNCLNVSNTAGKFKYL